MVVPNFTLGIYEKERQDLRGRLWKLKVEMTQRGIPIPRIGSSIVTRTRVFWISRSRARPGGVRLLERLYFPTGWLFDFDTQTGFHAWAYFGDEACLELYD